MNKDNTVRQAGGFILQLMPGASDEVVGGLERKLQEVTSVTALMDVGNTPETILQYILGDFGLEINDRNPARFFCNCSKSRVARALISLGKKELDGMIRDGEPVEVNCDFCGRSYTFDVEELQGLLEQAVRR